MGMGWEPLHVLHPCPYSRVALVAAIRALPVTIAITVAHPMGKCQRKLGLHYTLGVAATFTHGSPQAVHAAVFYLKLRDLVLVPDRHLTPYDGFHYAEAGVDSSLLLPRGPDLNVGRRGGEPQRERRQHRPGLRLLRDAGGELPAGGRRRRGAATERSERQRETPNPKCQHGLHGAADTNPHGTRGQKTLQNRDPAPGVQLYLPPGQRAGGRGRQGERPAVSGLRLQRGEGQWRGKTAPNYLHFLPQQPAQRGEGQTRLCENTWERHETNKSAVKVFDLDCSFSSEHTLGKCPASQYHNSATEHF